MSISIDGMASMLENTTSNATNGASQLKNSLSSVSSDSSDDELLQTVKDFESYFVEEVLKEVKESILSDDEEESDSGMSTQKDFYMGSVIQTVSEELVDQVGNNYTQQLYEQMKRNYNLD